ncbi:MAG: hypothetical protein IBX68_00820 [Dehalococcoidia bacterium]|nr:hypothetical protein [Dehalococcoidia bacterium]
MLFRSTGLGKTELVGKVDTMKRQGDYLIMYVDVIEPVKWRIRASMSFKDLARVMGCCVKGSIMRFILSPRQWRNRSPEHPGDF